MEPPPRQCAGQRWRCVSDDAITGGWEVPFGAHALASHGAPWLLLRSLAGERVRLPSKRNGAAAFVGARVDDNGCIVGARVADDAAHR